MRIGCIICFFLLLSGCWSNKHGNQVRKISEIDSLDILEIINTVLTDTSISWIGIEKHKILSETQLLPGPFHRYESYVSYVSRILSEKDTICVANQLQSKKKFTVKGMAKFGYTIVNLENDIADRTLWEKFDEKYGEGFLTISKPIFDCGQTRVFIRVGFVCGGKCGGGEDIVLEQINGSWILKEKVSGWSS